MDKKINASQQQHENDLLVKQAEIDGLNNSISGLTEQTAELTTQQNALNATIAKNTTQIKNDELKIIGLQTEKENLESSTVKLSKAKIELEQNNRELQKQFMATMLLKNINKQIIDKQAKEITINTDTLVQQNQLINQNANKLQQQEATMKENDAELKNKQEAIDSLSASIEKLNEQKNDTQKSYDETNKKLTDIKQFVAEFTTKKRELDEKEATLTAREGELSKSTEAFEEEKQQIQQEKDKITKELEASNSYIEDLTQELGNAIDGANKLNKEKYTLERELKIAKEEYKKKQIEHDKEYFIMLLDEVSKAEEYYNEHKTGFLQLSLNKDAADKVTGKKEYHDYLCTFNAFCSINEYVKFFDGEGREYLNDPNVFRDTDISSISKYHTYQTYITTNKLCDDTNKTTQKQTETGASVSKFKPTLTTQQILKKTDEKGLEMKNVPPIPQVEHTQRNNELKSQDTEKTNVNN